MVVSEELNAQCNVGKKVTHRAFFLKGIYLYNFWWESVEVWLICCLFINSYLFNRYFLIAFCMPETVVKAENTMFSHSWHCPYFLEHIVDGCIVMPLQSSFVISGKQQFRSTSVSVYKLNGFTRWPIRSCSVLIFSGYILLLNICISMV